MRYQGFNSFDDVAPTWSPAKPAESSTENKLKTVGERRVDWSQRVAFSCDMQAVPLPLQYRGMMYPRVIKPAIDRCVALAALLVLSPVMISIAALIKLGDGGPIFFRQERTGYLGQRFAMLKFRTMFVDAERRKDALRSFNQHGEASIDFKMKDDPRVTRIGRYLRKRSLDELPNLINVLRGEMALVGPRPTSFHAGTYRENHLPRLAVKPGLTGLWQVSGRANIDFDGRAMLDIRYVRTQSFSTDCLLIARTFGAVVSAAGAH